MIACLPVDNKVLEKQLKCGLCQLTFQFKRKLDHHIQKEPDKFGTERREDNLFMQTKLAIS